VSQGSLSRVSEGSESNDQLPAFSEVAPVVIGIAVWALLFVIGLVIRADLIDSGRGWWVWTAVAGVVLGLVGYLYLRLRRPRLLASAPPAPRGTDQQLPGRRTPDRS
jgi:hypothetical protein